jgi:hydroxymethylglutaryl-CoA lyase
MDLPTSQKDHLVKIRESDVTIVEVAPRDGLQNDPRDFPTSAKVRFIEDLVEAGCPVVETSSFVRPDRVPKMADGFEVVSQITRSLGVRYMSLVPNMKGLERSREARVDSIALFLSASEAFSQANTNCSITESLQRLSEIVVSAKTQDLWVRGYISVAFHCPFSGRVDPLAVLRLVEKLVQLNCDEIALADTIGTATPDEVAALVDFAERVMPLDRLALHLHDTHGQAIESISVAYDQGVRIFDSAAGGLGGCPFAPGAPGNVATESVLDLFAMRGITTGVDSGKVTEALAELIAHRTNGHEEHFVSNC